MKRFIFLLLLTIIFFENSAKNIMVNTANSYFTYLKGDDVFFDDQTNTVTSKKYGVFQNVKKVLQGTKGLQGNLIGTITDQNGKVTSLYSMSPDQALAQTKDLLATIQATADVLFNPVQTINSKVKPNPYPTTSKNQAAVDALCGPQGLNLDKKLVQYFKNFYFYFEYVVRVEYAARLVEYAHKNNIDVLTFMATKTWQDLVTLLESKAGGWAALEKNIFDPALTPDWTTIKGLIKASTWQELVTTPFWKSLDGITTKSLLQSSFWQKYVQYTITRSFVHDQELLLSIKQVESSIFKYIPNIEIAYYTPDFTSLRNASEMYHISLILTDALRSRYVPQAQELQNLGDVKKIYLASEDFKKTPFYSIASYADEDQSTIYAMAAQNKIPVNIDLFKQESLLQEELLLLSMIKVLHALINYLYDSQHLETTMNTLANKSIAKPQPSIFLYAPEDYLYLEDLNLLHDSIKQTVTTPASKISPMALSVTNKSSKQTAKALFDAVLKNQQKTANPKARVQSFFGDLWDDMTENVVDDVNAVIDAGNKVWNDMKQFGNDFIDFASDAGNAIADEAKSLGYGTAAAFLSAIDPDKAKQLLDDALSLQKEVASHVDNAKKELENTVTDVENVANDSVELLGTAMQGICDMTTANKDSELCKSLKGAFESAFEFVIANIAGDLQEFVSFTGGIIKLTADGIDIIATTAALVATGNAAYGADLVDQFKQFGADMAVSILEPLTFQFQYFIKSLGDILRFCQYFISIVTRLFIDATTAITLAIAGTFGEFANLFGANIDPAEWAESVDTALTEHERLIGTAITTALLLATIPLTGGVSAPLVVMVVGPQIFAAYGSWQADEEAIKQKADEKQFVDNFINFVATNSLIYEQQQNEWSQELQLKYTSELENQERNLGYYENFLVDNFEELKDQMASSLGSYWSQLLKPDATYFNMVPADVGSLYGFKTGVYELNPSQGFSLYSSTRQSFSQEIAVAPALATEQKDFKQAETKNWFNQKEIVILDQPATEVEVRFQAIYLLKSSFYIGLYFGGNDISLADVQKTKKAPLDLSQLAKMAVYKKENDNSPVTFGVYEHEGKGWLTQSMNAPQFELGTWYRIKMSLQGKSIQVKVWRETDPEPSTALMLTGNAPSPSQKIIGVISSSASVEYEFIKPQITPTANPKIRPKDSMCSIPCDDDFINDPSKFTAITREIDREKAARINLEYLLNPTLGATTLNSVGKLQILRNQYIYTTPKTNLTIDGKVVNDYVVPCTVSYSAQVPEISDVGAAPQSSSGLISLISESVYSNDIQLVNLPVSGAYDSYVKSAGPLTDGLSSIIEDLRKKYLNQGASLTLGAFTLQLNQDALKSQGFVYMAPMRDDKGAIIKDAKNNPIQDYFLLTVLDGSRISSQVKDNPGISYTTMLSKNRDVIGITSLVSGNLYGSQNTVPLRTYKGVLGIYEQNHQALPDTIVKAITNSQNAYKAISQPTGESTQAPDTGSDTKKVSDKDISNEGGKKGTESPALPIQKPADKSEQQKADQSSGGDYGWGNP